MLFVVACSSASAPLGGAEEDIKQTTITISFNPDPPITLFFVIDLAKANGGDAAQIAVASALQRAALRCATGDEERAGLPHPVTVHAVVAGAGSTTTTSIEWREDDATQAGAARFASAVSAAMEAVPDGEAGTAAINATLARLVTTIDPSKDGYLEFPITSTFLDSPFALGFPGTFEGGPPLSRSPIMMLPNGHPACRLLARFNRPVSCEPGRGWLRDPSDPAGATCEIAELPKALAGPCLRREKIWNKTVSGWCLPSPLVTGGETLTFLPRIIGDAAPPDASIEIACNLAR